LPIARAKTPNLVAKEAGTSVLGSPYPTTKASCQVLPGGLEKIPHILGIFFLTYYFPFCIFKPSRSEFLLLLLGLRIQRTKNFTLNLDITGFARLHDSIGIISANKYLNLEDKV